MITFESDVSESRNSFLIRATETRYCAAAFFCAGSIIDSRLINGLNESETSTMLLCQCVYTREPPKLKIEREHRKNR